MKRAHFSLFKRPDIVRETVQMVCPFSRLGHGKSLSRADGAEGAMIAFGDVKCKDGDVKETERETFPFLTFAGEIRNKIYWWAWVMAREKNEMYNIPDLQIHGDVTGEQKGGIRWMNVPSFPLLFASKQLRSEVFPIISAEAWVEIKTYVGFGGNRAGEALNCIKTISRSAPLLESAKKVSMDLTPKFGEWMTELKATIFALSKHKKIKELTAKVFVPDHVDPKAFINQLGPLYVVLKANPRLSLCLELCYSGADYFLRKAQMTQHETLQKAIGRAGDKYCGESAEIWVGWTSIPENELERFQGFW